MKTAFSIALLPLLILAPLSALPAKGADPKPLVYIANSYDPDTFGWTAEENQGIFIGFAKKGMEKDADYRVISDTMDALVKSTEPEMKAQATRILGEIAKQKPAIVITTDDDALQRIGLEIDDIPVVFNGVNGRPDKYLASPKLDSVEKPGHNITGVYQTTYFKQSLDLLKRFYPDAETFAVISDDITTSRALLADIKSQLDTLPVRLEESLLSHDFSRWQEKIARWQNRVDLLYVFSNNAVRDETGKNMPSAAVTAWIVENSRLPDTSPWAYQVKEGILVSASDSAEQQGFYAGLMAADILNGTDPGTIAIITPPKGIPVINEKRAMKLGTTVPPEVLATFIETGRIY